MGTFGTKMIFFHYSDSFSYFITDFLLCQVIFVLSAFFREKICTVFLLFSPKILKSAVSKRSLTQPNSPFSHFFAFFVFHGFIRFPLVKQDERKDCFLFSLPCVARKMFFDRFRRKSLHFAPLYNIIN